MDTKLEIIACKMTTCPACGDRKPTGQVVCWGNCYRDTTNGYKFTQMTTDAWLRFNCYVSPDENVLEPLKKKGEHKHIWQYQGANTDSGERIENCTECEATRDSSGGIIE